jgi:hypothetical protein
MSWLLNRSDILSEAFSDLVWTRYANLFSMFLFPLGSSSYSQPGPETYASDALQPAGLLCHPEPPIMFDVSSTAARCLYVHTTWETLVAQGGTCGRELSGNFAQILTSILHLGILYMPQICDIGPTALLPLQRKVWWGFLALKNPTASVRFEPANLGTKRQYAYL